MVNFQFSTRWITSNLQPTQLLFLLKLRLIYFWVVSIELIWVSFPLLNTEHSKSYNSKNNVCKYKTFVFNLYNYGYRLKIVVNFRLSICLNKFRQLNRLKFKKNNLLTTPVLASSIGIYLLSYKLNFRYDNKRKKFRFDSCKCHIHILGFYFHLFRHVPRLRVFSNVLNKVAEIIPWRTVLCLAASS